MNDTYRALVALFKPKDNSYTICYDTNKKSFWQTESESKENTAIKWIGFYALLFCGYFLQPLYSQIRNLLWDIVSVVVIAVFVIAFPKISMRIAKAKITPYYISEQELFLFLPQIKKQFKTQVVLLCIGIVSFFIGICLFIVFGNFVFLAVEMIGGLISETVIQFSHIAKKAEIIQKIQSHSLI